MGPARRLDRGGVPARIITLSSDLSAHRFVLAVESLTLKSLLRSTGVAALILMGPAEPSQRVFIATSSRLITETD